VNLKTFLVTATHVMLITFAKFHWNPSTKQRSRTPAE